MQPSCDPKITPVGRLTITNPEARRAAAAIRRGAGDDPHPGHIPTCRCSIPAFPIQLTPLVFVDLFVDGTSITTFCRRRRLQSTFTGNAPEQGIEVLWMVCRKNRFAGAKVCQSHDPLTVDRRKSRLQIGARLPAFNRWFVLDCSVL